jgi:AraC-binding-like domain
MTTMPHSIHRTAKLIRQADPEVFKLGCIVHGGGAITQDDQRAEAGVGDLTLYDTSRSYRGDFTPDVPTSRLLLLRFPRSLLPLPHRDLRRLSGARIPGPRASVRCRHSSCCSSPGTCTSSARPTPPAVHPDAGCAHHGAGRRAGRPQRGATPGPAAGADGPDPRLHPGEPGRCGPDPGRDRRGASHLPALPAQAVPRRRTHRRRLDPRAPPGTVPPRLGRSAVCRVRGRGRGRPMGFANQAHFSRAFRGVYGLSPRQFREQQAASKALPAAQAVSAQR